MPLRRVWEFHCRGDAFLTVSLITLSPLPSGCIHHNHFLFLKETFKFQYAFIQKFRKKYSVSLVVNGELAMLLFKYIFVNI